MGQVGNGAAPAIPDHADAPGRADCLDGTGDGADGPVMAGFGSQGAAAFQAGRVAAQLNPGFDVVEQGRGNAVETVSGKAGDEITDVGVQPELLVDNDQTGPARAFRAHAPGTNALGTARGDVQMHAVLPLGGHYHTTLTQT